METYDNYTVGYYEMSDFWLHYFEFEKKTSGIMKFLYAFLLLVGTFGNILCCVFLRKYYRTSWSVCFYLILSMFFGLLELYIYCGNAWFHSVTNNDLTLKINILSNAVCKVYNFFTNVLLFFNSWIMVAISIETMITIVYPHRMYKMCSVDKARPIVLFITVLVICFNLHYFWTIGLSLPETDPEVGGAICHDNYQPQMADQVSVIVPLFNVLLEHVFPFVIVTVCASISIISTFQNRKNLSFELKKYIVDTKTLEQLRKPMLIMLVAFGLLKACLCSEQLLKFINMKLELQITQRTMDYFAFGNLTLTYIFLSFKPVVFIALCEQLRIDIFKGLGQCVKTCLCRPSQCKPYIAPEAFSASDSLMQTQTQNGQVLDSVKCTKV